MSVYLSSLLFVSPVQFNSQNNIDMICRAHQLVMEGFKWYFDNSVLQLPAD